MLIRIRRCIMCVNVFKSRIHSNRLSSPSFNFITVSHQSTISEINDNDDYILDTFLTPTNDRNSSVYPHNVIKKFTSLGQLQHWKRTQFAAHTKGEDEAKASTLYTTLMHTSLTLKEYEYTWQLFAEVKRTELLSTAHFTVAFQLILEQYVTGHDYRMRNRKGVQLANTLYREMHDLYGISISTTIAAQMLKIYLLCNEYARADKVWTDYLAMAEDECIADSNIQTEFFLYQSEKPDSKFLEHYAMWNSVLSLYRRQNKIDKVFDIYHTMLACNRQFLRYSVFVQLLMCVVQLVESEMSTCYNIPQQKRLCLRWIGMAEQLFIDAHKFCRASDSSEESYLVMIDALIQSYAACGLFHLKVRNFWKLLLTKDVAFLYAAFEAENARQIDDRMVHRMQSLPMVPAEFTALTMLRAITKCVKEKPKKFDVLHAQDITDILDEILRVARHAATHRMLHWSDKYNLVCFECIQSMKEVMENMSYLDGDWCYLYMFKFYNLHTHIGVTPNKYTLSTFAAAGRTFFKYYKQFQSQNTHDLRAVHNCVYKTMFDKFIAEECKQHHVSFQYLRYNSWKK